MLEIVVKRDGRKEPRDDRKLNGWGEWGINHLAGRVDYSRAVANAVKNLPKEATSQQLMDELIAQVLEERNWAAYLFAGRLYAVRKRKEIYGSTIPPTVQMQHANLIAQGFMAEMSYSMSEYSKIEEMIDHSRDYEYPEFSLKFMHEKYAIRNYYTKQVFETPQFIYMRMAMAVCEHDPVESRMYNVRRMYNLYSQKKLSSPTPNYLYLGTKHRGFASCCIYTANDSEESMLAAMMISWKMTVNSAGLGSLISTRTVGDPINGGRILHSGRYNYLQALAKMTGANKQASRAGAGTTSTSFFDPEAVDIVQYRNPLMPEDKRLRDLHYNMLGNAWFVQKVADNEDIFTFTEWSQPELWDAFFSPDIHKFVELYEAIERNPLIEKKYISARKLVLHSFNEAFTTGTAYVSFIDEMNRHTPFKISKDHRIHCSNLCTEIMEITQPYENVQDLYSTEDHGRGEIAMCNLGAINYAEIDYKNDEQMAEVAYYALKATDYTVEHSDYPFPHLAMTAKARRNAGISVMGLATVLARAGLRWDTFEGKQLIHEVFEAHMFHLIHASIRISKERGLAPWIHKTKWPEGWTPMKTYNRNVDTIGQFTYRKDWDEVSAAIIENGGLAHSTLGTGVPGESSSKALGATNSYFPIPDANQVRTDGNNITTYWAAQDSDLLGNAYQNAYDINVKDMIECYAVMQKWLDQGLSADLYRKWLPGENIIKEEEVVFIYTYMCFMGMKTRYYTRNRRPKQRSQAATTRLVFTGKDGQVTLDPQAVADKAVADANAELESAVTAEMNKSSSEASHTILDPVTAAALAARQQIAEATGEVAPAEAFDFAAARMRMEAELAQADATRTDSEYADDAVEEGCSSGFCKM